VPPPLCSEALVFFAYYASPRRTALAEQNPKALNPPHAPVGWVLASCKPTKGFCCSVSHYRKCHGPNPAYVMLFR